MLTFKQSCRIEEESTAKRIEKAYQKKQRDKKIKKFLSTDSHWKGLNCLLSSPPQTIQDGYSGLPDHSL